VWDDPIFGGTTWSAATGPSSALAGADHVYLSCVSHLVPFFQFLLTKPHRSFTPVLAYGRHLLMGPRFDPHTQACPACFAMSLLTNLPSLRTRWQERHRIVFPPERKAEVAGGLEVLVRLREVDTPRVSVERLLVLDFVEGTLRDEAQVLRLCRDCAGAGELFHPVFERPADLVGEFVGAIRRIERVATSPLSLAVMAASSEILDQRDLGGGVASSHSLAARKALFETIERVVINHTRTLLVKTTSLDADHPPSPPADDLRPYTEAQYQQTDFPLARYDECAVYLWLTGTRLRDGSSVRIPADFVLADREVFEVNRLAPPTSTGAAAFDAPFRARQAACLELVERDVVTRCWYRRALFELPTAQLVPTLAEALTSEGMVLRLFLCNDTEVAPVVVAGLFDADDLKGAVGCAAGVELHGACTSAVYNAATMLAHRLETSTLLSLSEPLDLQLQSAPSLTISLDWDALVTRYDPIVFALSPELLRSRGAHVMRAWSPRAVGFPHLRWPLPRAQWFPDANELRRIEREIGVF
jgi:hypothetical protein